MVAVMVKSVAGARWPNNTTRRLKLPVALGWGGLNEGLWDEDSHQATDSHRSLEVPGPT